MNQSETFPRAGDEDREAHLRSILATVPDAMVVIDERGFILSFSAAAEKMFGFSEDEVLGENVSMLMPSPDRERHDGYLEHYRTTNERKIIGIGRVTTARHRDGYTFPIELSVGEAWLGEKRIFTGFIHDITQRQKTQLRLQGLQSDLAHVGRVSEMGTLASSLAHELNQPLTAIANYYEKFFGTCWHRLLMKKLWPSSGRHLTMRPARRSGPERSFVGSGTSSVTARSSGAPKAFRASSPRRMRSHWSARANMASTCKSSSIQMPTKCSSTGSRFQQVIVNLIRNAIDAMLDSPLRSLTIRTEAVSHPISCASPSRTVAQASAKPSPNNCFSHLSHQRRAAWVLGCRFAEQSLTLMAAASGSNPLATAVPSSTSPCRLRRLHEFGFY